ILYYVQYVKLIVPPGHLVPSESVRDRQHSDLNAEMLKKLTQGKAVDLGNSLDVCEKKVSGRDIQSHGCREKAGHASPIYFLKPRRRRVEAGLWKHRRVAGGIDYQPGRDDRV